MKIGIDIDEVLANHMDKLNEFYFKKTGKKYSKEDYKNYNWWETWGTTREEATKIDDEFKKSEFFSEISVIPGAKEAIENLSENHELVIITSRPVESKRLTSDWFNKNFNNFKSKIIHSGDFWGKIKTKAEICNSLSISLLIEDHEKYAKECAGKGIKVILFDKPWNQNIEHENIARVNNWKEALKEIQTLKDGTNSN